MHREHTSGTGPREAAKESIEPMPKNVRWYNLGPSNIKISKVFKLIPVLFCVFSLPDGGKALPHT